MSKNLSKNKKIKSTFTAKQPGYINVAGETFFLSDEDTVFSAALVDDSLKGELAFQELFLKPFTPDEQTSLRRIYSTIFGSSSVLGPKGLALPCEDQEVDLLVKSLIYRRDKLIQQIQSYRILLSNDLHARHMRDHLLKLNTLIDDDIPNTLTPCKDTDLDLEGTGKLSGLTNDRMLKLLEIFAFLLAQGKDPLMALRDSNPSPIDILPRMAKREAKKLRDYEAEFTKENPDQVPQYTETLKKIRRVLMDTSTEPATDKELLSVITDIETDLGIEDKSGSAADRKARILQVLRGLKQSMIEEGNCKRTLASMTAERDRLKALVDDCEKKVKEPGAEIQRLKDQVTELENKLQATIADLQELEDVYTKGREANDILRAQILELKKLVVELEGLRAKVAKLEPLEGKADITQEALDALNASLDDLEKRANITPEELKALDQELTKLRPFEEQNKTLQADVARLEAEIIVLKNRGDITPEELTRLQAEVDELRPLKGKADITQEALDTLRAEVAKLKERAEITPYDLATLRAQVERLSPFEARADITEADLDALQAELALLRPLEGRADITVENLLTLQQELEALRLRADITPRKYEELLSQLALLRTQVENLKGSGELAPETIRKLQDQLQTALTRIETLEGENKLIPELQRDLSTVRARLAEALDKVRKFEGRAEIKPEDLTKLQTELQASQGQILTLQAQVRELEKRPDISSSSFEEYKAAKLRLAELDRILPNLTPDRLQELLKKEREYDDIRKRLQSYQNTELDPTDIASLKAEVEKKKAEVNDLRNQLGDANRQIQGFEAEQRRLINYEKVFTNLNELLVRKGFASLPIPTDATINNIQTILDSYLQKPSVMGETTNLCILSIVYRLMRNVYTKRGTSISTDYTKYANLFKKIDTYSNQPIDIDLVNLFFLSLSAWKKQRAPTSLKPIIITREDDKLKDYKEKFDKFQKLTKLFNARERDAGSYILRELIPIDNDFTRYILNDDATISLTPGVTLDTTTDMGLLFLIFLTYVNKTLQEKRPQLEAAGCPILK